MHKMQAQLVPASIPNMPRVLQTVVYYSLSAKIN